MKKISKFLFFALLAIFLTACGNNDNGYDVLPGIDLDFRSMRDVELDVIISLGDSISEVRSLLGEPSVSGPPVSLASGEMLADIFENGMWVTYMDGFVDSIRGANGFYDGRFEVHGYTIGMTHAKIAAAFHPMPHADESLPNADAINEMFAGMYAYANFFDTNGNRLRGMDASLEEMADTAVSVHVYWAYNTVLAWEKGVTLSVILF